MSTIKILIVATKDVTLAAANNLTIQRGQDTASNTANNKAVGSVVVSDTERFSGYHTEDHDYHNQFAWPGL
jgi:filamentous hemagglutinin